ncbi:unnamed protein product [Mytilus coruscus]|uniref:DZANK-type domain-containing protein n=1 Tax=Mytilus coruscus TaxID=42192 RepID=A0A6J8E5A2_MYTCO|nr:unnamed protein product [Mytilus coruscus]
MNCTKCGAELSPGAKFCEECGNRIPEQTFICQKCLNPLKKNQKFCVECGSRIDPTIYLPKNNVCKGKTDDGNLCGAILNTDEKFCSECGHSQHEDEPPAKSEEQAESSISEQTTGIQEANPERKSGDKDLQQLSSSNPEKPSKSKKKKKKKKGKEKVKPEDKANHGYQKEKAESNLEGTTTSNDRDDRKTQVVTSTIRQIGHQSSGSGSGSGAKRKNKGMEVVFHAALVEQFINNESAETVCLEFDFGRAKMRHDGSFTIDDEVYHKYEAVVVFSEPTSNDKVYNYNYFVTRTNGEKVMEYVHNNGTNVKCRTIHVRNLSTNVRPKGASGIGVDSGGGDCIDNGDGNGDGTGDGNDDGTGGGTGDGNGIGDGVSNRVDVLLDKSIDSSFVDTAYTGVMVFVKSRGVSVGIGGSGHDGGLVCVQSDGIGVSGCVMAGLMGNTSLGL